jgi:hypothetical protein
VWCQCGSLVEVLLGHLGHAGPSGVGRQSEVEARGDLAVVEVRHLVAGVVRHGAVADPGPDLLHVVLAVDAGEPGEHVAAEL